MAIEQIVLRHMAQIAEEIKQDFDVDLSAEEIYCLSIMLSNKIELVGSDMCTLNASELKLQGSLFNYDVSLIDDVLKLDNNALEIKMNDYIIDILILGIRKLFKDYISVPRDIESSIINSIGSKDFRESINNEMNRLFKEEFLASMGKVLSIRKNN